MFFATTVNVSQRTQASMDGIDLWSLSSEDVAEQGDELQNAMLDVVGEILPQETVDDECLEFDEKGKWQKVAHALVAKQCPQRISSIAQWVGCTDRWAKVQHSDLHFQTAAKPLFHFVT